MRKRNIVLVDDETSLTRMLKLHLEDTGNYIVNEINDGRIAVGAIKEIKPDIVLLDLMMPDIHGEDIATELLSDPFTSNIKIIFLSAKSLQINDDTKHLRSITLLKKPINIDSLLNAIDDMLKDIKQNII